VPDGEKDQKSGEDQRDYVAESQIIETHGQS
jgi:hypothetical protein